MGHASGKLQLGHPHWRICRTVQWKRKCLILALMVVSLCAFAQQLEPSWLNQIRLSGVSGPTNNRLAIINDNTFATGEGADLKLKGRTIHVRCLGIQDQSALIQIQGLPTPYELTMDGSIVAVENNPAVVTPAQVASKIEPPAQTLPPRIIHSVSSQPTVHPHTGSIFTVGKVLVCGAIFLALAVGIALGSGIAQSQHRKNIGEALLAETIDRHFARPHLLLNNVTLPTPDGTTQIDHVLIADNGIFVIETKHYSGWIFGDPNDRQWTQTIYRRKSRFQNPLRQNYGHIKALQSLFDLPENHFYSVVVFTSDAEFKTNLGPNVVQLAGLIPFLNRDSSALYDERKMAYIVGRIEMKRARRSVETDEYHINHLRNRLAGQIPKPKSQTIFTQSSGNNFATGSGDEKYQPKS
jgi:hypothetical protein